MGLTREDHIDLGRKLITGLLLQWAEQIAGAARKDLGRLKNVGMTAEALKEIDALSASVKQLDAAQEAGKRAPGAATAKLGPAHRAALTWWHKAKRLAVAAFSGDADVLAKFRTGIRIGPSVPRLMEEMNRLIPVIREQEKELSAVGAGKPFAEEGEKLLKQLTDLDREQEEARKRMPEGTANLYEARGKLYDAARRVVRLARAEFISEPDKASRYTYDILRRERVAARGAKTRRQKKAG